MRNIFTILVLFTLGSCSKIPVEAQHVITKYATVLPIPPRPNDTAYVIFKIGQSNDAGRVDVSTFYVGGNAYLADPMIYNGDSGIIRRWVATAGGDNGMQVIEAGLTTSDNNTNDQAGIQPYLAYQLIDYKNTNIYFFQGAEGGESIIQWSQSVREKWKFCDSGFASMRAYLEGQGKIVKVVATIWIQGETDFDATPMDSTVYKGHLDSVLYYSRLWTDTPDLPFIMVQAMDCQTAVTNLADLQACQQTWAWTNVGDGVHFMGKGVDDDDCLGDNLHYALTKYLTLGERIFQLIKDW